MQTRKISVIKGMHIIVRPLVTAREGTCVIRLCLINRKYIFYSQKFRWTPVRLTNRFDEQVRERERRQHKKAVCFYS